MEINELYNKAKFYIDKIKKEKPFYFFERGSSLCLIQSDSDTVFSGTTCIRINKGNIETVSSEYNAVMSLLADKKSRAGKIIVVTVDEYKIASPDTECIQMLIQADSDNARCRVILSESESVQASDFCSDSDAPVDFFSGFDDDTPVAEPPQASSEFSESSGNNIPPVNALNNPNNRNNSLNQNQAYPAPNQSGYQQNNGSIMNNAMPYPVQTSGRVRSVHGGSVYMNSNSQYISGSSQYASQYLGSAGSAFRKRLENFLGDDEADNDDLPVSDSGSEKSEKNENLSRKELLKQAKKNKKAAKHGLKF